MGGAFSSQADPEVILVTGTSRGIGKMIAMHLVKRFPAARVYGTSRSGASPAELRSGKMKAEAGKDFLLMKLNVDDDVSCKECVDAVLEVEGKIDVLINNAAILIPSILALTEAEFAKDQFETNFHGVVRMVQAVMPSMLKRGEGKVINMGSVGGRLPIPYQTLYSASKAALAVYSDGLRLELMRKNIQVALIEPGDIRPGQPPAKFGAGFHDDPVAVRAEGIMRKEELKGSDPMKVARCVESIIKSKNPAARNLVGPDAYLVMVLQRILPDALNEYFLMDHYSVPRREKKGSGPLSTKAD